MTELILFEPKTSTELLFTPQGVDAFFAEIEEKVKGFKADITSKEGRDEIRSFARRIASAKIELDEQGKTLTDGWRASTDRVNAERKRLKEKFEGLQERVRQPLTDFENAEKERIKVREDRILEINNLYTFDTSKQTTEVLDGKLRRAEELIIFEWDEFADKAKAKFEEMYGILTGYKNEAIKREADAAALAKLQKEDEERKAFAREEQLKKDATIAAEAKAQREAKEKIDAAQKAQDDAEKATKKAEQDKADVLTKAEEDKQKALQKAEDDKKQAVIDEQNRQAEQVRKDEEAKQKREANVRHRTKLNNKALKGFTDNGIDVEIGKKVIELIAKGLIANIIINY